MTIHFTEREKVALRALSVRLDLSEEKVIRQALAVYQLQLYRLEDWGANDSPGCGVVE